MRPGPAREAALVAALLGALALQLAWGIASDGMTNDEVLYVSAGYRQLALGDFQFSPTHPPLAQSLAGLGLLGLRLEVPPLRPAQDVLDWCWQFLHARNCAGCLLWRARVPSALLTLALAGLLFAWARAVAGPAAGLAAAFLAAFHPSLIAHGHLATTDMPATVLVALAAWTFWRWLSRPSLARALVFALSLGLGAATRVTTGVVVPVFLGALLLTARRPTRPRAREVLALVLGCAVLVPAVIWAAYGFHDPPWPDQMEPRPRVQGPAALVLDSAEATHLLPALYLEGVRFQVAHNRRGHPAYLLGARSRTGWWYYQAVAFAVKNTPGFLLALGATLLVGLRSRRRTGAPIAYWLALAAVVFGTASLSRVQIGERYLLPAYPFLILAVACQVPELVARRRGAWLLAALALLHAGPTLAAAPGSTISYFNVLAGGRRGGHRVLVDSNLDWGQDLPRLARWMRRQGVASVQLAYQGADDPGRFGIAHQDLPGDHLYPAHPAARPFHGVVVVSPTLLYGFHDPYAALRARPPDERAGVFFVYRFP